MEAPEGFHLIETIDGGIMGNTIHPEDLSLSPYTLTWENDLSLENFTENGLLVTLVYEVDPTVAAGVYEFRCFPVGRRHDVMNADLDSLPIKTESGTVTVLTDRPFLLGDINNDGDVTSVDRALLSRYIAGWPDMVAEESYADINGDGSISAADRVILSRYLAGWGEEYAAYFAENEKKLAVGA